MFSAPDFSRGPKQLIRRFLADGAGEETKLETAIQSDRAAVLDAICTFLLDHRLEISSANLLAAHAAFSGQDAQLRALIAERQDRGQTISQHWLDTHRNEHANVEANGRVEHLADWLSSSVHRFTDTTGAAWSAAQDYGRDLASHLDRLRKTQDPSASLANAIESSQTMAQRARLFEDRLRSAEAEANTLRRELEHARREAMIDALTQLPNRRGFEAMFEGEFKAAAQSGDRLSIAMCDIDHFKRINDGFGHNTGDNIIRAVAQTLLECGENCHAARYGGEEFVILFRGYSPKAACQKLDRARRMLNARRFVHQETGDIIGKVSFSGGVVDALAFTTRSHAVRAADEALYHAKSAGRNRVRCAATGD